MMCVDCGREVEGLVGGSCPSCFAARNPLLVVPDVVDVETCAHCGARHVGAHWHEPDPETPEEWVLEDSLRAAVRVHAEVVGPQLVFSMSPRDAKTFEVTARVEGELAGVPVTEARRLLLRRTRGVCDRCSRIQGGYFAAIIQMRATERTMSGVELERAHRIVSSELDRQLETGNRQAFLSKSGPMHGGYDYYVGDIEAARNVARRLRDRLGASMGETAKLVGRREGEDVYRVTFLVRLPPFSPGDIVLRGAVPHLVLQVHQKGIASLDLERHHRGRVPLEGLKRLGGPELLEEAVVVSKGPEGVQVVDPRTHKTETILVAQDAEVGPTVHVVRFEERLHWVPVAAANNP